MDTLSTPFGEITVLIDGKPVPFSAQEGRKLDVLCPHVSGRYRISVRFSPDMEEHTIACVFSSDFSYERTPESGERLECQSFYNESNQKLSIGLECEEAVCLENGLSYKIPRDSKRDQYVFGICWIDDVRWNDQNEESQKRDIQTWFGADPSLPL